MSLGKPQIWQKNFDFAKIIKNQQMLVFCDNSFDNSLVLILKYTVCEFYDSRNLFDKMTIF